jgi:recombinational DNA repair protein (RecF pathway)
MDEYTTQALVLEKEMVGEADVQLSFFTKEYGKIVAKAKSVRKITSRLAGHLEPGSFCHVRFVEKNYPLVVDALKYKTIQMQIQDLRILSSLLVVGHQEDDLWEFLSESDQGTSWGAVLNHLGWGAEHATCSSCNSRDHSFFYPPQLGFFCQTCAFSLPVSLDDLLRI